MLLILLPVNNPRGLAPVHGWKGFVYPVEGHEYEFNYNYASLADLITHIRQYEEQNHLMPIPHLAEVVQDHFCRTCEQYRAFCKEVPSQAALADRTMLEKFKTLAGGASALMKINKKGSLPTVDLKVVKERAKACASCNLNAFAPKTPLSDEALEKLHEKLYVEKLKESYEVEKMADIATPEHRAGKLGTYCKGCACNPTSKVYLDKEYYAEPLLANSHDICRLLKARIGYGDGICWQLKEILNKKNLAKGISKGILSKEDLKNNS